MKKGFMKSLALLLAMLMTLSSLGVGSSALDERVLSSISISAKSLTLVEEQTQKLTVFARFEDGTDDIVEDGVHWSSDDNTYVTVSSNGEVTAVKETTSPVYVYATYTEGGVTKEASCPVTVTKKQIMVDRVIWTTEATSLYAGTSKEYSFDFSSKMYTIVPDNAYTKAVSLSCTPAYALQIDNENKTFKVNPLEDKETLQVTLTLTADGAGPACQPVSKTFTIYRDIPIQSISWNWVNSTRTPLFRYYEKDNKTLAVYYFMPTEMGNPYADYKFLVRPSISLKQIMELCTVTFTSSDKRVLVFDENTGRIIPVGNGSADLTITIETPKGKVFRDTVTGYVQDSPYTPITSMKIGYDESINCEVKENEIPKISVMYEHDYQLTAVLNKNATLNNKAIEVKLDDGNTIKTVKKCEYDWKSENESIVEVERETGKISVEGVGDTVVTLTVNDSGEHIVAKVRVHAWMSWWEALSGLFLSFITFRWGKIPMYFRALIDAIVELFIGSHC